MIYEEPLVWRPGQVGLAAPDGSWIQIDMAFTDYVIDVTTGEMTYARPTLEAYVPTVNVGSHTITMTAPESAFPQESAKDVFGVMIYSHSAFYSSGTPAAWDWTGWDGTGYAFLIGKLLYIVSGLFCHDYKFVSGGFGRYLLNTTNKAVSYPPVPWIFKTLYTLNTVAELGTITDKAGGLAKRDISSGADPETVENIANKAVKCGWTALLDGSDRTITTRIQSEDGTIDQWDEAVSATDNAAVNISATGRSLLVGYTAYQETVTTSVNGDSSSLTVTLDADVPKTCDVFTFGDYAPDEWGEVSLIEARIVEHGDQSSTVDCIFPCSTIYDRGQYGLGDFAVVTDSMADSFVATTLTEDTDRGLKHWRNSTAGFNIVENAVTGALEFIPATTYNTYIDCRGVALDSTALLRQSICSVIVEALENAGVY